MTLQRVDEIIMPSVDDIRSASQKREQYEDSNPNAKVDLNKK
jgi:hypothetical protein